MNKVSTPHYDKIKIIDNKTKKIDGFGGGDGGWIWTPILLDLTHCNPIQSCTSHTHYNHICMSTLVCTMNTSCKNNCKTPTKNSAIV